MRLVVRPEAPSSVLLLFLRVVVRSGAAGSFLLLVRPGALLASGAPNSFFLLVVRPGALVAFAPSY